MKHGQTILASFISSKCSGRHVVSGWFCSSAVLNVQFFGESRDSPVSEKYVFRAYFHQFSVSTNAETNGNGDDVKTDASTLHYKVNCFVIMKFERIIRQRTVLLGWTWQQMAMQQETDHQVSATRVEVVSAIPVRNSLWSSSNLVFQQWKMWLTFFLLETKQTLSRIFLRQLKGRMSLWSWCKQSVDYVLQALSTVSGKRNRSRNNSVECEWWWIIAEQQWSET